VPERRSRINPEGALPDVFAHTNRDVTDHPSEIPGNCSGRPDQVRVVCSSSEI
jgi:hypothetical protein